MDDQTKTFGKAAAKALTAAADSQGQSTANSQEAKYSHFLKCLRLWEAMLPKRAGDEVAGELMARGYFRMLGHLSEHQMNTLTEMVLGECKWFPTVAECNEIMGRKSYSNPFYIGQRHDELDRLGYNLPAKQIAHD